MRWGLEELVVGEIIANWRGLTLLLLARVGLGLLAAGLGLLRHVGGCYWSCSSRRVSM